MKLPWVSRVAYELALEQIAALRERNDRLTEAVSRAKDGTTEVMMPRDVRPLEVSAGWWDNVSKVKENKNV